MSIRANAGIMKDENRSKARKKAGQDWGKIGNKSECGIRVKDGSRSKARRSGAGLGKNQK